MSDINPWFVQRETYEREIVHPVTKEKVKITLRALNAGDRAEFNEIRLLSNDDGSGEGSLRPGRMQLLAVERAVVAWEIPGPQPSLEAISQLDPRVFDQLYELVSFGNPKAADAIIEGAGKVVPLGRDDVEQPAAASS